MSLSSNNVRVFKVGDKVRINTNEIGAGHTLFKVDPNKIFEVTAVDDTVLYLRGIYEGFYHRRFTLVKDKKNYPKEKL